TNVFKEVGSKEGGRISVVIPQTSKLSSVTVSGASRFVAEQPMTAEKISVKLSGASKVKAEIQAGVLSARVTVLLLHCFAERLERCRIQCPVPLRYRRLMPMCLPEMPKWRSAVRAA
ncbi:MAG: hypothetical protein K2G80_08205, partial [Bacteroidales bacterium]|nr:hypothetical protein [Bacteroidales bacterium]